MDSSLEIFLSLFCTNLHFELIEENENDFFFVFSFVCRLEKNKMYVCVLFLLLLQIFDFSIQKQ